MSNDLTAYTLLHNSSIFSSPVYTVFVFHFQVQFVPQYRFFRDVIHPSPFKSTPSSFSLTRSLPWRTDEGGVLLSPPTIDKCTTSSMILKCASEIFKTGIDNSPYTYSVYSIHLTLVSSNTEDHGYFAIRFTSSAFITVYLLCYRGLLSLEVMIEVGL